MSSWCSGRDMGDGDFFSEMGHWECGFEVSVEFSSTVFPSSFASCLSRSKKLSFAKLCSFAFALLQAQNQRSQVIMNLNILNHEPKQILLLLSYFSFCKVICLSHRTVTHSKLI